MVLDLKLAIRAIFRNSSSTYKLGICNVTYFLQRRVTFQVGLNMKANGGVENVKGVIAQVSFSIIWFHISYLVSLKSLLGPKRLYLAFVCVPAKKFCCELHYIVTYNFLSITFKFIICNHPSCKFS